MTNMETLFIGYPPCSTCKKAYKALLDLGIEATYRNIKEENPTKEEIQSWIDRGVELKKLFNTSGMLYRELNIKEKRETYTQEQLIELLASNGMLVKRPIVIQGDMIIIGNKVSEYEKLQKTDLSMTGLSLSKNGIEIFLYLFTCIGFIKLFNFTNLFSNIFYIHRLVFFTSIWNGC